MFEPEDTSSAAPAEPTTRSLIDRIHVLEGTVKRLQGSGLQLVEAWRNTYSVQALPFYLARVGGESHTLIRWRRAGKSPGAGGRRFELLESPADLAEIPEVVMPLVRNFERRRQALNFVYSLAAHELDRSRALLRLRRVLQHLLG